MVRTLSLVALLAVQATAPALAAPGCTCRFEGRDMNEGAVVCIDLASGTYLARCERVLNNTAWRKLRDGCAVG